MREPGLQSVASAIGTRCARKAATGGDCFSPQRVEGAGQGSTATVPAAAIAAQPASSVYSM